MDLHTQLTLTWSHKATSTCKTKPKKRPGKHYEPYQCCQSDAQEHGEAAECFLQVCQDVAALPRHAVIEQGEGEAVEVAEAVLVWVVAVVPSALTVHP